MSVQVEIEVHTVPHFKATINTKVEPDQLVYDCIFISHLARPKIGHLLHKTGFVHSDMHTTVYPLMVRDILSNQSVIWFIRVVAASV